MRKRRNKLYTPESLHAEREYGFYWYAWLWSMLRPVLVFACALILLMGVVSMATGYVKKKWVAPVDPKDSAPVAFVVNNGDSLTRVSKNLEK